MEQSPGRFVPWRLGHKYHAWRTRRWMQGVEQGVKGPASLACCVEPRARVCGWLQHLRLASLLVLMIHLSFGAAQEGIFISF